MGRAVEAFTPPRPVHTTRWLLAGIWQQRHAQQLGAKQAGDGWPGRITEKVAG
jgi:hypothetical protein